MKKYSPLIFTIIAFIIRFAYCWFRIDIFNSLFFLVFIPGIKTIALLLGSICFSITMEKRDWINITAIIISLFALIMHFIIPFLELKTKCDLKIHEKEMLEVIEMVKNNDLVNDGIGNYNLPKQYKNLSDSGQVYVHQNDENGQVISFWIIRGLLNSGSITLTYTTGDEELIKANEGGHKILSIKKFKDNWYYVDTD